MKVYGAELNGPLIIEKLSTLSEFSSASDIARLVYVEDEEKIYYGKETEWSVIGTPAGALLFWPTETPPAGWLERDGSSLLRADYPSLFAVIGTMFGTADGTHFNLPDDRGYFPRGWAHGQSTDPDRASRTKPAATGATISDGDHVGTEQADAFESHTHTLNAPAAVNASGGAGLYSGNYVTWLSTMNSVGGSETRPLNRVYMPIIKY